MTSSSPTLSEYVAMLDKVARALCAAQDLDWDAQANFATSGSGGDNEQDYYLHLARAALTAMGINEPTS